MEKKLQQGLYKRGLDVMSDTLREVGGGREGGGRGAVIKSKVKLQYGAVIPALLLLIMHTIKPKVCHGIN